MREYQLRHYFVTLFLCATLLLTTIAHADFDANELERYVDASVNKYHICPPETDPTVKHDLQKEFIRYQQMALKGNAKSQYVVGMAYLNGIGISQDADIGLDWIYQSAIHNNGLAQAIYGTLLSSDKKRAKNLSDKEIDEQKLEWFQKSIDQHELHGELALAGYYLRKENYQGAHSIFEKLAGQQQNAIVAKIAQVSLGKLYFAGFGVQRDFGISLYWYEKSVEAKPIVDSDYASMQMIILIYNTGPFKDEKKSSYWAGRRDKFHLLQSCETKDHSLAQ